MNTEALIKWFESQNGYVSLKQIKSAHIRPAYLSLLEDQGIIEKIKPGLYRSVDLEEPNEMSLQFTDIANSIPDAIIGLDSALAYYDLTTYIPHDVAIILPHAKKPPKSFSVPARFYYFRKRFYTPGIKHIQTKYGEVKITNQEKTICDIFRYRKKLGEDIALESLKKYLSLKSSNIHTLMEYADVCQVKTIIQPYIKAIAG